MKLPASLTTVTTFSKLVAMLLFILFPIIGFKLGMVYQKGVFEEIVQENLPPVAIPVPPTRSSEDNRQICEMSGGTFFYELNEKNKYMECEGIDEQTCGQIGGRFNECASPCRHDPSAEVCIELCVFVCSF